MQPSRMRRSRSRAIAARKKDDVVLERGPRGQSPVYYVVATAEASANLAVGRRPLRLSREDAATVANVQSSRGHSRGSLHLVRPRRAPQRGNMQIGQLQVVFRFPTLYELLGILRHRPSTMRARARARARERESAEEIRARGSCADEDRHFRAAGGIRRRALAAKLRRPLPVAEPQEGRGPPVCLHARPSETVWIPN